MKVLIADDSAAMRRILQRALEAEGWEVVVASTGDEAAAKVLDLAHLDLLLTDWHMPGLDGMDLVREVRRLGRFPSLKIIMVTSDAVLDSVEQALAAGADDFLMKPFTAEALNERVMEVMRD